MRHSEIAFHNYYRYSYYWTGPNLWGAAATPGELRNTGGTKFFPALLEHSPQASCLRSTNEISRYQIAAEDGDIGYLEDFIIDDETWAIRYLIVDTGDWWPGKKVMLSPQWITHIRWSDRRVYVDLELEEIKNSPEYDESAMIDRAYELRLYATMAGPTIGTIENKDLLRCQRHCCESSIPSRDSQHGAHVDIADFFDEMAQMTFQQGGDLCAKVGIVEDQATDKSFAALRRSPYSICSIAVLATARTSIRQSHHAMF